MVKVASITEYTQSLVNAFKKVDLKEFMMKVKAIIHPEMDMSFMDYFLELSKEENDGQFIVHHDKLIEYGITTSDRSRNIRDRLVSLGCTESEEFLLLNIQQQNKTGSGGSNKKVYMLTPEAFKKCLMRARNHKTHTINAEIYANYYLFLEKVITYYTKYQLDLANALSRCKDDKIDSLIESNKELLSNNNQLLRSNQELTSKMDQQSSMITDQTKKIDQLMIYAEDANEKLDIMFDFMVDFAKITLPMWVGSSVFKTQLQSLIDGKSLTYALKHLKLAYLVGFYHKRDELLTETAINGEEIQSSSYLKLYFCCTNFADVPKRLRELSIRHRGMMMLKPRAICLVTHDINKELAILDRLSIFPEDTSMQYLTAQKSFMIGLTNTNAEYVNDIYDTIKSNAQGIRFQGYQSRMDELINSGEYRINQKILSRINTADSTFFRSALPFCQEFLDCHVNEVDNEDELSSYEYQTASRKTILRTEFNERMADNMFALSKLNQVIEDDVGSRTVDDMVQSGIITKRDLKALKKVAEVEKIDISDLSIPDDLSDDSNNTDEESD